MAENKARVNSIIKKALDELRRDIVIEAAVLFGSYAAGRADKDSDIDLAVFSKTVDKWTTEQRVVLVGRVKDISPLVELHLYSDKALKEARPTNFYGHILKTGKKVA